MRLNSDAEMEMRMMDVERPSCWIFPWSRIKNVDAVDDDSDNGCNESYFAGQHNAAHPPQKQ